jgi:hypothetical protein
MAFIPVPDTAQTIMVFQDSTSNKRWTTHFNWLKAGGWDTTALQALNQSHLDAFGEGMQNILSTQTGLVEITSVDLSTADGAFDVLTPSPVPFGAIAGTPLALNSCVVVTYRTDQRGRSFRGRSYLSGQTSGQLVNNRMFTASWAAGVETAMLTTLTAIALESGAAHVIVSRQQGNVSLPVGETTPVTDIVGRQQVGTQRLRLTGN